MLLLIEYFSRFSFSVPLQVSYIVIVIATKVWNKFNVLSILFISSYLLFRFIACNLSILYNFIQFHMSRVQFWIVIAYICVRISISLQFFVIYNQCIWPFCISKNVFLISILNMQSNMVMQRHPHFYSYV